MSVNQPWPALEEVMGNFAELMQRLLEIQSGGRPPIQGLTFFAANSGSADEVGCELETLDVPPVVPPENPQSRL